MAPKARPRQATPHDRLLNSIRTRAAREGGVLGPCLRRYDTWVARHPDERLHNLSVHLIEALPETADSIRTRMALKWQGHSDAEEKIASSVTNSLRRSAGTNYQALVTYALAEYLRVQGSPWFVEHPVPKAFGESLAIRFTGGVPDVELDPASVEGISDDGTEEARGDAFRVTPDLDILMRHSGWADRSRREPILVLSVKTSLADRAGSAARWKNYFDLVTKPCPHTAKPDCAYGRLGMTLEAPLEVEITHGIVTANIYKINSDEKFARDGELGTGQARANTFMFDLKITTRNDGTALQPPGWEDLSAVPRWLNQTSNRFGLPVTR